MGRESFQHLVELVAALERGELPPGHVCRWFTAAISDWARATDARPLAAHLGVSQRLRRHYIVARQRDYLADALLALVSSKPDHTDYALAGEFVEVIDRTARALPLDDLASASVLVRSLALALMLPIAVPRSREHWRQQLARKSNLLLVCGDHEETATQQSQEVVTSMEDSNPERSREQLEAEWGNSAALQQEFETASLYAAYVGAQQRGLVKLFRREPR